MSRVASFKLILGCCWPEMLLALSLILLATLALIQNHRITQAEQRLRIIEQRGKP